jgi:hypothetical protein
MVLTQCSLVVFDQRTRTAASDAPLWRSRIALLL